jgi:hypothetical protein
VCPETGCQLAWFSSIFKMDRTAKPLIRKLPRSTRKPSFCPRGAVASSDDANECPSGSVRGGTRQTGVPAAIRRYDVEGTSCTRESAAQNRGRIVSALSLRCFVMFLRT